MEKAREFYVEKEDGVKTLFVHAEKPSDIDPGYEIIPVIEKSAYENMAEKAVGLSNTLIEVQKEKLDLEAKLNIAVEALEKIGGNASAYTSENCYDFHQRTANGALDSIKDDNEVSSTKENE